MISFFDGLVKYFETIGTARASHTLNALRKEGLHVDADRLMRRQYNRRNH